MFFCVFLPPRARRGGANGELSFSFDDVSQTGVAVFESNPSTGSRTMPDVVTAGESKRFDVGSTNNVSYSTPGALAHVPASHCVGIVAVSPFKNRSLWELE